MTSMEAAVLVDANGQFQVRHHTNGPAISYIWATAYKLPEGM
jgi:hypothetical protein